MMLRVQGGLRGELVLLISYWNQGLTANKTIRQEKTIHTPGYLRDKSGLCAINKKTATWDMYYIFYLSFYYCYISFTIHQWWFALHNQWLTTHFDFTRSLIPPLTTCLYKYVTSWFHTGLFFTVSCKTSKSWHLSVSDRDKQHIGVLNTPV